MTETFNTKSIVTSIGSTCIGYTRLWKIFFRRYGEYLCGTLKGGIKKWDISRNNCKMDFLRKNREYLVKALA